MMLMLEYVLLSHRAGCRVNLVWILKNQTLIFFCKINMLSVKWKYICMPYIMIYQGVEKPLFMCGCVAALKLDPFLQPLCPIGACHGCISPPRCGTGAGSLCSGRSENHSPRWQANGLPV